MPESSSPTLIHGREHNIWAAISLTYDLTSLRRQCELRRLAPLSVCLPTVVNEFSQLTARLRLMDCKGLLPQRAQAMRAQRPLEMFFPFDPYLLRRSAQVCLYHQPLCLPQHLARAGLALSETRKPCLQGNGRIAHGGDVHSPV